jgi:hypothetical protein
MKFRAELLTNGKTATGIEVPSELVEELGGGKKPAVRVTINGGHSYRSTIAVMGGQFLVGVSAENRAAAGVAAGDELDVELTRDTAPRTIEIPPDLAAALAAAPAAKAFFDGLSFSQQRWFVDPINDAKKPETRATRIEKAVARLSEGRGAR